MFKLILSACLCYISHITVNISVDIMLTHIYIYSNLNAFSTNYLTTRLAHNIFAVGIKDQLSLRWIGHRSPCETTGIQAISLHQTSSVFILLGFSMILGTLVLCIEALYQGFSTRGAFDHFKGYMEA